MDKEHSEEIYNMIGVKPPIEMHGCIKPDEGLLLYDVILNFQPEYIIETGSGVSTFFILKALQILGKGSLVSIDKFIFGKQPYYQDGDYSNREKWILPIIKDKFSDVDWTFIANKDSAEYLEANSDLPVDLFFHDSCHELVHIRREWLTVKDKTRIFVAHNSNGKKCSSFYFGEEFTKEFNLLGGKGTLGVWEKKH